MRFTHTQFGLLRTRLLVLVLLVLLPAFGLVWYGTTEQQRMERRSVRQNALATAKLAATSQEYFIKHTQHMLATLTQFPFLTMATDRPFCEWHLANLKLLQPEYADFGLIEADGTLFCTALKTNPPVDFSNDSVFQRVIRNHRFSLGNLEPDPVAPVPTLRFGYPVQDTNGVTVRVLYASLNLPLLSQALLDLPLAENGSVMVLDRNGTVVARHPQAEMWVGRHVAGEPYVQTAMNEKEGTFVAVGSDEVSRIVAVSPISDGAANSFHVLVEAPRTLLFASVKEILARNLLLMLLVGVVVLVIAWLYTARALLRPVEAIHEAARRLSRGDLSARTGIQRDSTEIHQLAGIFDEMAENLARRRAELEQAHSTLESRVEKRTSELAAANAELEAFSYSVSHDLRAPLRHIDGYAQILREEELVQGDPTVQKYVGSISKSARRMGTLIDDLLRFSRTGKDALSCQKVDFNDLVQGAIRDLQSDQDGRIVDWKVPRLPVVYGDPSMLRQVWMNLISNAVKYTGSRAVAEIEIGFTDEAHEKVFFVRDNGAGFDMASADRLFGVFQRLHRDDEFQGTGIGLALVRRIIHRHQGRTWAEARIGEGATFYFSLPQNAGPHQESSLAGI